MTQNNQQPEASNTKAAEEIQPLDALVEENPELGSVINKKPDVERLFRENPDVPQAIMKITQHSGPMPPPEMLEAYNKMVPGIAGELFNDMREDSKHIREMERKALNAKILENTLGQVFGFLIGTVAIIAGAYTAVNGAELSGGLIGGGGVVALTAVFVLGRKPKK